MSTRNDNILDAVKLADRIRGDHLNNDIYRLISVYEEDLTRAGVPETVVADSTNKLVEDALIMGVLSNVARDEEIRKRAEDSYNYRLDCLRKHNWEVTPNE